MNGLVSDVAAGDVAVGDVAAGDVAGGVTDGAADESGSTTYGSEVGSGSTTDDAANAPGSTEDILELPASWRRVLHPRRGGAAGAKPAAAKTAAAEVSALMAELLIAPPLWLGADESIAGPATTAAADPGAATPLGAASVMVAAGHALGWRRGGRVRPFADVWWSRGPAFAAAAVVEAFGLAVVNGAKGRHLERGFQPDDSTMAVAARVRALLAGTDDEGYGQAREALAAYRTVDSHLRLATSFLMPTETDWVDADVAAFTGTRHHALLLLTVGPTAAMGPIAAGMSPWHVTRDLTLIATMLDGVGSALAPTLAGWLDSGYSDADAAQRLLTALALIPTDEAMGMLIDRRERKYVPQALLDAAARFPVRATRLLAAQDATAAQLRAHVLSRPDAAQAALPLLDEAARARIAAILDGADTVAEAAVESVPPVLVDPPWLAARKPVKPRVVAGLPRADECEMRWADGQQETWAARGIGDLGRWQPSNFTTMERAAELIRERTRLRAYEEVQFFGTADPELVLPLIGAWSPQEAYDEESWLGSIVGRYGTAAHAAALRFARSHPADGAPMLEPYASSDVARLAAGWYGRLKSMRRAALEILLRHPDTSARALIPDAVGQAGATRREAEQALRAIAESGAAEAVIAAAAGFGPDATAAVAEILAYDPLLEFPAKLPAVPAWADAGLLPQVRLRGGAGALPRAAVTNLVTMLIISPLERPYAGLAAVREACEPRDLSGFAWTLFTQWQGVGCPSKESWALGALGHLGDDETVRRLAPIIRAWPGEGGHARAVVGLDVLAAIGTDVALMHLHRISQRVKFQGLKERAREKMGHVATRLGLLPEQLADRLVPDLGLDANGAMELDYGPRRFTVGFDEQLKPYVSDEGGRRKSLPKPGPKDDPELAPAAYTRFSGLKKDVRTLAGDQIARLEAAMVSGRRWRAADFRQYLVGHPLLGHIVRRLVWAEFPEGGTPVGFRVAEDRTYADVTDETVAIADDALVGVAHPLHLGDGVAAWSEVFADYELLQPFVQLGRVTYRLSDEERAATTLDRFAGAKFETAKLLGLERRGWYRGAPQDAGVQCWIYRTLPDGRSLSLVLDPGIAVGYIDMFEHQTLDSIFVSGSADGEGRWRQATVPLGDADPVCVSEMIRDLTEVAG